MRPARVLMLTCLAFAPSAASAQSLADRGEGVPTSMFGTYITKGELQIYPFFEAYKDDDFEYKPEEFGAIGDTDYRGRFRATEGLIFIGYGITDDLAFEMEVAGISATFDKSPVDPSAVPARITESGLGDIEGQLRWRWRRETATRPELFSYAEIVLPHHGDKVLIGTSGTEIKFGTGLIRGFRWGTLTTRAAIEFASGSSSPFDVGEYAVEYLKRLGPRWRVYAGLEGTQDELSAIAELQWHLSKHVMLKINNGFGVTSKATDYAPEIGILFSIPLR